MQVKRYQDQPVDWPEIEGYMGLAGEARFCFFSTFGFTVDARVKAEEHDVVLLEAAGLVRFLLGGGVSEPIRRKLRLPRLTG